MPNWCSNNFEIQVSEDELDAGELQKFMEIIKEEEHE